MSTTDTSKQPNLLAMAIHPDTAIGAVRLTVADLARSRDFYERVIGLRGTEHDDGTLTLGVEGEGEAPLIELVADATAPALDRRATGLFHLAILVPTRRDLALALRRIAEARWPLDGASDHLVSEALYLSDPDGNGIEIYRDRPRKEWPHDGDTLQMATLPLDLESVIGELLSPDERAETAPPARRWATSTSRSRPPGRRGLLLRCARIRRHRARLPGRAVRLRRRLPPSHRPQHLAQRGGSPPAPGAVGMRAFEIELPDRDALERTLERTAAGRRRGRRENGSAVCAIPRATRRPEDAHHDSLASASRRYATQSRRRGGVATQRPAKPSTPVRFRSSPSALCRGFAMGASTACPERVPGLRSVSRRLAICGRPLLKRPDWRRLAHGHTDHSHGPCITGSAHSVRSTTCPDPDA